MPKDGAAIINHLIRIAINSSYSSLHKFDWGSNIQNIIEANWKEPFTLGRNTWSAGVLHSLIMASLHFILFAGFGVLQLVYGYI